MWQPISSKVALSHGWGYSKGQGVFAENCMYKTTWFGVVIAYGCEGTSLLSRTYHSFLGTENWPWDVWFACAAVAILVLKRFKCMFVRITQFWAPMRTQNHQEQQEAFGIHLLEYKLYLLRIVDPTVRTILVALWQHRDLLPFRERFLQSFARWKLFF